MAWFELLSAGFTGGLAVKGLDIMYIEYRRRFTAEETAKHFVDQHLDPLLKAADELVGKLRSLANTGFSALSHQNSTTRILENRDFRSILFLFARFWASLEKIRIEGLSVSMASVERGKLLQDFVACLESRKVRIVDRTAQRALGELLLRKDSGRLEIIGFIDFVHKLENDVNNQRWIEPLASLLIRTKHTKTRQQLLQYFVVVHAMIDTLDPDHSVTKDRPSCPRALSKKTKTGLKYRVFGEYLKAAKNVEKYIGPPNKRRP